MMRNSWQFYKFYNSENLILNLNKSNILCATKIYLRKITFYSSCHEHNLLNKKSDLNCHLDGQLPLMVKAWEEEKVIISRN